MSSLTSDFTPFGVSSKFEPEPEPEPLLDPDAEPEPEPEPDPAGAVAGAFTGTVAGAVAGAAAPPSGVADFTSSWRKVDAVNFAVSTISPFFACGSDSVRSSIVMMRSFSCGRPE